jgi:hypothetical protein
MPSPEEIKKMPMKAKGPLPLPFKAPPPSLTAGAGSRGKEKTPPAKLMESKPKQAKTASSTQAAVTAKPAEGVPVAKVYDINWTEHFVEEVSHPKAAAELGAQEIEPAPEPALDAASVASSASEAVLAPALAGVASSPEARASTFIPVDVEDDSDDEVVQRAIRSMAPPAEVLVECSMPGCKAKYRRGMQYCPECSAKNPGAVKSAADEGVSDDEEEIVREAFEQHFQAEYGANVSYYRTVRGTTRTFASRAIKDLKKYDRQAERHGFPNYEARYAGDSWFRESMNKLGYYDDLRTLCETKYIREKGPATGGGNRAPGYRKGKGKAGEGRTSAGSAPYGSWTAAAWSASGWRTGYGYSTSTTTTTSGKHAVITTGGHVGESPMSWELLKSVLIVFIVVVLYELGKYFVRRAASSVASYFRLGTSNVVPSVLPPAAPPADAGGKNWGRPHQACV